MPRLSVLPFLVFFILSIARPARAATEPADSPEVAQMVAQGDALSAEKHFDKALDAYRKADKLTKHTCAACDLRMFDIDRKLGDLSAALDDAKHAVKAAGDNKTLAVAAHVYRGALLAEMSGKPSDKKLKEAEEELRSALAIEPGLRVAHFDLGTVLLKQERDEEGIAELKTYTARRTFPSRRSTAERFRTLRFEGKLCSWISGRHGARPAANPCRHCWVSARNMRIAHSKLSGSVPITTSRYGRPSSPRIIWTGPIILMVREVSRNFSTSTPSQLTNRSII